MAQEGPEHAIFFAILGVLTAIGVPALQRGQGLRGWACIALAAALVVSRAVAMWRARR